MSVRFCREVCDIIMSNIEAGLKIEGIGTIVEIDECHQCQCKYYKGRYLKTEALWIFGGICRENNEFFIERVKRRDEKTLILILQRYVDKNSVILSDHWPVYTNLAKNFVYLENHIVIHQYHYLQTRSQFYSHTKS